MSPPRRCCTWRWCRTCCPRSGRRRTCRGRTSRSPPATIRPGCTWRCCRSARRRCGISCSSSARRAWRCTTRTGWPPSAGRRRRCGRATSRRTARTSRPSATCTGRSRPASSTWRRSTASGGCSSARRAPRPPSEYFGWPELVPVTDVASARRAIGEILEQGEGPRGDWRNAHFGQFVEILDEFEQLREADRGFDPVRPVVPVNVRPSERDPDVPLVTDPLTSACMDLFNVCYEILLLMLQRFFAHTEETDAQLRVLADGTLRADGAGDQAARRPHHRAARGPGVPRPDRRPELRALLRERLRAPHREAAWVTAGRAARGGRGVLRDVRRRRRRRSPGSWPRSALRWPASPAPWPHTCPPVRSRLRPRRARSFPRSSAAPSPFTERALTSLPATMFRRARRRRESRLPCAGTHRPFGKISDGSDRGGAHHRQRAAAARRPPRPGTSGGRTTGP